MVGSKHAGVFSVMSLGISSRLMPTARRAAILAMGKPVALLARAELRETRGFISMMTMRPFRSEEHTSEFQSHSDLVCRLLLEKKKKKKLTYRRIVKTMILTYMCR